MHISSINLLAEAVITAYGTRILHPNNSEKARCLFVHLATAAGFSIGEIADALGCQLATVVNAAWAFKRDQAHDPNGTEVILTKVEAILELLHNGVNQPADPCGVRAPNKMTAEFWGQVVEELRRSLTEAPNGLECDFIADAYESQVAGKLIPCDAELSLVLPPIRAKTGELLEMSFRAWAIDGYADGDKDTTFEVVLTTGLSPAEKEAA